MAQVGPVNAAFDLHAVNGTAAALQRVAGFKQRQLQIRALVQQLPGGIDAARGRRPMIRTSYVIRDSSCSENQRKYLYYATNSAGGQIRIPSASCRFRSWRQTLLFGSGRNFSFQHWRPVVR